MQVHGVIDETTLVWGQGLQDWLPVRNVRTLVPQIRTPEGAPCNALDAALECVLAFGRILPVPATPWQRSCVHMNLGVRADSSLERQARVPPLRTCVSRT